MMPVDSGVEDAGRDAGRDAGPGGGGGDAGRDAGPPAAGCSCGDAGICGTGALGDPLRCCNYRSDSCFDAPDAGYCATPRRCSPVPPCCADDSCLSSVRCPGPTGGSCVTWLAGSAPADGTPCDDGRACTSAEPPPALIDCAGIDGGPDSENCDVDYTAAFPTAGACPRSIPSCTGRGSAFDGNGGRIMFGRCCPQGMTCDFRSGPTYLKCIGNFGRATTTNDVCRAGVCVGEDAGTCP